ncbi:MULTISPECIES: hypothetical protein [unclassified Nocardia]|uniref:phage tail fiber protein n=1 Tax=unclassified Nocardia TaxID=2637762 RepID=UPI0024A7AA85|nr:MULTISPECIES: hypothetical protein [unclassified Nocardia]
MAISVDTTRQALADAYAALGPSGTEVYISLHTADPLSTGEGEVSGGEYARRSGTWVPGSGGVLSMAATEFDVPAGTFTHVGLWTAASDGQFLDGAPLSPEVTLSGPGVIAVTPRFTVT